MPSPLHQTLVDLLRHAPQLLPRLLAVAGATPVEGTTVRALDAVLDQIERRVDLAFEITVPGVGSVAAGVEIQLTINPDKLRTWPVYLTTLRSKQCPRACLLIVTPDPRVAAWAARPIDLGPGNKAFRVHVVGPDQIPRINEAHIARHNPELGFLSALAHADEDRDPELVRTALAGLTTLDRDGPGAMVRCSSTASTRRCAPHWRHPSWKKTTSPESRPSAWNSSTVRSSGDAGR
jgi:hypothetical protein